jgi:transcriptional regulator of met regulon
MVSVRFMCKHTRALVMPRCEEGSYRQRKVNTKSLKRGFKVAHNQLTKKWIQDLREVTKSTLLLEALGMPLKISPLLIVCFVLQSPL